MSMIKNKKDFALGFFLSLALLGSLLCVVLQPENQVAHVKDNVFIFTEKASGRTLTSQHNVITDIGENRTGEFHNSNTTSANGVLWISIGNATAAAGLTQLTTQYGSRFLGTVQNWTNSGDFAYNITYTHMFTETQNINAVGAHWSDTGDGNLYAVANFAGGATTFNNADNLTITWVYTFDCN